MQFLLSGSMLDFRSYHPASSGNSLPVDLLMCPSPWPHHRNVHLFTQGQAPQRDWASAITGSQGSVGGGSIPPGVQLWWADINGRQTTGVLAAGNPSSLRGIPPLRRSRGLATSMQQCGYNVEKGVILIVCNFIMHMLRVTQVTWIFPRNTNPGRREPSLCGSDCNAVSHPLLVAYEDSFWLNWSRQ